MKIIILNFCFIRSILFDGRILDDSPNGKSVCVYIYIYTHIYIYIYITSLWLHYFLQFKFKYFATLYVNFFVFFFPFIWPVLQWAFLTYKHKTWFSLKLLAAQSCPTLCDLMDCSPPDSSVHGIIQVRILEWVAISFSKYRFIFVLDLSLIAMLHLSWSLVDKNNYS